MTPQNQRFGAEVPPAAALETQQYATRFEVEEGLHALTDADYAKLIMTSCIIRLQWRNVLWNLRLMRNQWENYQERNASF